MLVQLILTSRYVYTLCVYKLKGIQKAVACIKFFIYKTLNMVSITRLNELFDILGSAYLVFYWELDEKMSVG